MKTKPKVFNVVSLLVAGVALAMPLQIAWIYGHSLPEELGAVLAKLSWLNLLVMVSCSITAVASWRGSGLLRLMIPLSILSVAVNNWNVAHNGSDFAPWAALLGVFLFASIFALFLEPNAKKVLLNPALRWWRIPERRRVEIPVQIQIMSGETFHSKTFDLSKGGLFVPLPLEHFRTSRPYVTLKLVTGPFREVRCDAEIVRRTDPEGIYPQGVGLKLVNVSALIKQEIAHLLEQSEALEGRA